MSTKTYKNGIKHKKNCFTMDKLVVKGKEINITGISDDDYVSLTDLACFLNEDDPRYPIQN